MGSKGRAKFVDVVKLVVKSLGDLRNQKGSTLGAIKNHILQKYEPAPNMRNQISAALTKGVALGVFKNCGGYYKLDPSTMLIIRQHGKQGKGKRKRRQSSRNRRSPNRRSSPKRPNRRSSPKRRNRKSSPKRRNRRSSPKRRNRKSSPKRRNPKSSPKRQNRRSSPSRRNRRRRT